MSRNITDDKNSFGQDSIFWKMDYLLKKIPVGNIHCFQQVPKLAERKGVAWDDITNVFRETFEIKGDCVYTDKSAQKISEIGSIYQPLIPKSLPEESLKKALREIKESLMGNKKFTVQIDDKSGLNEAGMRSLITALVNSKEKSIAAQCSVNSALFEGLKDLCVTPNNGSHQHNFNNFVASEITARQPSSTIERTTYGTCRLK